MKHVTMMEYILNHYEIELFKHNELYELYLVDNDIDLVIQKFEHNTYDKVLSLAYWYTVTSKKECKHEL